MTIRKSPWPEGTPCWADISVEDLDSSRMFYSRVIGWEFPDQVDGDGYSMAAVRGHHVAGVGPLQQPGQPISWLMYFASKDADSTAELITRAGGTVVVEPFEVLDIGRMLVAVDPTGAMFAVWQAHSHPGFQLASEPGGVIWEDLRSSEPEKARQFYSEVFGFETHEVEMAPGDYQTFHLPGDSAPLGGMGGFMGPEIASHWQLYFCVADLESSVAAVKSSGGSAFGEVMDTPYGRMVSVSDPEGATFQLMEEAEGRPQPDRGE